MTVLQFRQKLEERTGTRTEHCTFRKGDILAKEGFTREERGAILVVEGVLLEQQEHFVPNRGVVNFTVNRIKPMGIAFVQGLTEEMMDQPSLTTIVAETDGSYLLRPSGSLDNLGEFGRMLVAEIGNRRQILTSLIQIQLAGNIDAVIHDLAEKMNPDDQRRDWTTEKIKRSILAAMTDRKRLEEEKPSLVAEVDQLRIDLANAQAENERLQESLKRQNLGQERLQEQFAAEKRVSGEARALVQKILKEKEAASRASASQAKGWECYYERVCQSLTSLMNFTETEAQLLLGEVPDELKEDEARAQAEREREYADLDQPEVIPSKLARIKHSEQSPSDDYLVDLSKLLEDTNT